ncbi:MAG TPA: hypothetical protein VF463_04085 [Sphingobium sp.]
MPKMNERERLAKIEAEQRNLANEAEAVRRSLRAQYGQIVADIAVERLTEREFREILGHVVRVGGAGSLAALKGLSDAPSLARIPPARG